MPQQLSVKSLAGRETDRLVLEVIRPAVGYSTPEKMERIGIEYRDNPSWHLYGIESDDRLLSVIGIEALGGGEYQIRHIATTDAESHSGYGRSLIEHVLAQHCVKTLWAETDADAVGFYERCGFNVVSLGGQYPEVERFRCTFGQ